MVRIIFPSVVAEAVNFQNLHFFADYKILSGRHCSTWLIRSCRGDTHVCTCIYVYLYSFCLLFCVARNDTRTSSEVETDVSNLPRIRATLQYTDKSLADVSVTLCKQVAT